MSIERGNERTYYENFMPQNTGSVLGEVLSTGAQIFNKVKLNADMAQMSEQQAKQNIELYEASENHKVKWQSNPTSDLAKVEWNQTVSDIQSKYNEQISPMVKKLWYQQQSQTNLQYQALNSEWALNQNKVNTQTSLKNSIESNLNLAQKQGLNGDLTGALASYANSYNTLVHSGSAVLGEETAKALLHSYEQDYMTMFISGLTEKNPSYALKLLDDNRVKASIKDNEQITKLKSYAQNKFVNLSKETAINDTAKLILAKGDMGTKLLQGKATYTDLQKFFQSNKNLSPNQRDLLSSMAGYSTFSNYHINRDTGAVEYIRRERGAGGGVSLSPLAKESLSSMLEIEGAQLFSFDDKQLKAIDTNKRHKLKNGREYQSNVQSYLNRASEYQQKVDAYFNAGVIDKATRQRLNDNYITPMSNYLQANLKDLDEHNHWWAFGKKLGYNNVTKEFNTNGLKGKELSDTQRELALAQMYYFDNLSNSAKSRNMNSVYDIEKLSSKEQQEIYRQASDNAIKKAKANSINPSYWFERDYPTEYSRINRALTRKEAKKVSSSLAGEIQKSVSLTPSEVSQLTDRAIKNQISSNRNQAQKIIDKAYSPVKNQNQSVMSLQVRAERLGITLDELNQSAKKYNVTPQYLLTKMELQTKR